MPQLVTSIIKRYSLCGGTLSSMDPLDCFRTIGTHLSKPKREQADTQGKGVSKYQADINSAFKKSNSLLVTNLFDSFMRMNERLPRMSLDEGTFFPCGRLFFRRKLPPSFLHHFTWIHSIELVRKMFVFNFSVCQAAD